MFSEMVLFGLYSKVKVQKCSFSQCSGYALKDVTEKIVLHVDGQCSEMVLFGQDTFTA